MVDLRCESVESRCDLAFAQRTSRRCYDIFLGGGQLSSDFLIQLDSAEPRGQKPWLIRNHVFQFRVVEFSAPVVKTLRYERLQPLILLPVVHDFHRNERASDKPGLARRGW